MSNFEVIDRRRKNVEEPEPPVAGAPPVLDVPPVWAPASNSTLLMVAEYDEQPAVNARTRNRFTDVALRWKSMDPSE